MSQETNLSKAGATSPEKLDARATHAPPVDIYENAEGLLLFADLPGVAKDELSVSFDKGHLTIEARRAAGAEGTVLASELRKLDYRRVFAVPSGIDADKITASLEHGVLRVELPKSAALKPRRIEVRAG